jgi:putative membrane protein
VVFIAVAMVLMSRWISESDRRLKFGSLAALLEKEQEP